MPPLYPGTLSAALTGQQAMSQPAPEEEPQRPRGAPGPGALIPGVAGAYGAGRGLMSLGSKLGGLKGLMRGGMKWGGRLAGGIPNMAAGLGNGAAWLALGDAPDQAGWHDASRLAAEKVESKLGPLGGAAWDAVPGNIWRFAETAGEGAKHLGGAALGYHGLGIPTSGSQLSEPPKPAAYSGPTGITQAGPPVLASRNPTGPPPNTEAWLKSLPEMSTPAPALQANEARNAALAPKSGDSPLTQQNAAQAPPNPGLGSHYGAAPGARDPLEALLMQRLQASMKPGNYLPASPSLAFNVAGPIDPSGLGSSPLGQMMGFQSVNTPHQAPYPAPKSTGEMMNDEFHGTLGALLGARGAAAKQTEANASMQQATMGGLLGSPAGNAMLESKFGMPAGSMQEAREFPNVSRAPDLSAWGNNPERSMLDLPNLMESLQRRKLLDESTREFIRRKMLSMSREAIQGELTPYHPWNPFGWYGDYNQRARRAKPFVEELVPGITGGR